MTEKRMAEDLEWYTYADFQAWFGEVQARRKWDASESTAKRQGFNFQWYTLQEFQQEYGMTVGLQYWNKRGELRDPTTAESHGDSTIADSHGDQEIVPSEVEASTIVEEPEQIGAHSLGKAPPLASKAVSIYSSFKAPPRLLTQASANATRSDAKPGPMASADSRSVPKAAPKEAADYLEPPPPRSQSIAEPGSVEAVPVKAVPVKAIPATAGMTTVIEHNEAENTGMPKAMASAESRSEPKAAPKVAADYLASPPPRSQSIAEPGSVEAVPVKAVPVKAIPATAGMTTVIEHNKTENIDMPKAMASAESRSTAKAKPAPKPLAEVFPVALTKEQLENFLPTVGCKTAASEARRLRNWCLAQDPPVLKVVMTDGRWSWQCFLKSMSQAKQDEIFGNSSISAFNFVIHDRCRDTNYNEVRHNFEIVRTDAVVCFVHPHSTGKQDKLRVSTVHDAARLLSPNPRTVSYDLTLPAA